MSAVNSYERTLLDGTLSDPAFSIPDPLYCGLMTAVPLETNTAPGNEVNYGDYARVAVPAATWGAAESSGVPSTKSNATEITFPAAASGVMTAKFWFLADAISAGNLFWYGMLATDIVEMYADAGTDRLFCPGHLFAVDDQIVILCDGAYPGGMSANTAYFVVATSADYVQISTTQGGGVLNITSSAFGIIGKRAWLDISTGVTPEFGVGSLILGAR